MNAITRRAAVTGIGTVSPIGLDAKAFVRSLRAGSCGIGPIQAFDASMFRCQVAAELRGFEPLRWLSGEEIAEYDDPYVWMAIAAVRQALADAGLKDDWDRDRRVALVVGTCNGGLRTAERLYRQLFDLEEGELDARMNLLFRYFAIGRALGNVLRVGGPTHVVTTACASSTTALGVALDLVQADRADVVLVGGSDALCLTTVSGFCGVRATATDLCTPFTGTPEQYGMNLGEGAGFWVVEERDRAMTRGATLRGEILGYGLSSDAYHPTSPSPQGEGAHRAMAAALERAGVEPGELASINAHGTGTEGNDRAESRAIGRLAPRVPTTSTKSMHGHCLGAAGILEASASLLSMAEGFVPPTLRAQVPRPGCELDLVANEARPTEGTAFLSSNLAFGGNNAAVVVGTDGEPAALGPPRDVVVTGAGAVSALGLGAAPLAEAIAEGRTGVRRVSRFDTSDCRSHRAGLLADVDLRRHARRLDLGSMNPLGRFATVAAQEALQSAGFRMHPRALEAVGVTLGVFVGPSEEALMESVWGTADHVPHVGSFAEIIASATAGHVSRALYLKGYSATVASGHQAGLAAALVGAEAIRLGHVSSLVAGGADEVFGRYFKNYDRVGYLARGAEEEGGGRPFEGQRRLLGEGAGMLVLEHEGAASARGARVLARVLGWASTYDPGPFVQGSTGIDGLVDAARTALQRGGCSPHDVRVVISSPMGNDFDRRERDALARVFEAGAPEVVHCVGATGYAEAASVTLALAAWLGGDAWPSHGPGTRALVLGTSAMGYNHAAVLERA